MTINGMNGVSAQAQVGISQTGDSYTKNIQSQIANAQKELQELSSNAEMTLEEKMQKRQEIQQEISNLNQQLRQHQIEQRKERQQSGGSSMEDLLGGTKREQESAGAGMSQASMTAILSADSSMKQAKVQSQVKSSLEGRAGVLKAELKTAKGEKVIEAKQAELAAVEDRASNVEASQMSTLSGINRTIANASKQKRTTEEENEASAEGKTQEEQTAAEGQSADETAAAVETETVAYTPIDVRL